jgi:molecular chaperone GrpE
MSEPKPGTQNDSELNPAQAPEVSRPSESWVDPSILLEAERDTARAEAADFKDKLLRTLADMENLRRRTEREVKDANTYGVTKFARDMLGVGDNLRRAIDAVPADQRDSEAMKAFIEGVELTERTLVQTLERHGVKAIEAEGKRFDPNMHQAMFELPTSDVAPGTVVQVLQTGYAIGERVLRPALVGVAKAAVS